MANTTRRSVGLGALLLAGMLASSACEFPVLDLTDIELEFRSAVLTAHVGDADMHEALAGARVRIPEGAFAGRSCTTDERGDCTLGDAVSVNVRTQVVVRVRREGYHEQQQTVWVEPVSSTFCCRMIFWLEPK